MKMDSKPSYESGNVPRKYYRNTRLAWDQRRRHRAILGLLSEVEGRVLDYGCGYGDITFQMSRTHPVEGVDVDTDRIAFASREYAPVQFRVCPTGNLDYPDQAFDIVTSVVVIHFTPDPVKYLRECFRVLRDGGHLIIACRNEEIVRNSLRSWMGKQKLTRPLWIPSRDEFFELLRKEGFSVRRKTFFYEPPSLEWKNPGDIVIGMLEQVLSIARIERTCSYYAVLARKNMLQEEGRVDESIGR